MSLFKLPPDEAERLVRYSEFGSVKMLYIPALLGADVSEEMKHDIAPHLYVLWLLPDPDTLAGFLSGDDDLWETGILDAARKAAGVAKSRHSDLVVDTESTEEWIDELLNSDHAAVSDFGLFMSDTWQNSCAAARMARCSRRSLSARADHLRPAPRDHGQAMRPHDETIRVEADTRDLGVSAFEDGLPVRTHNHPVGHEPETLWQSPLAHSSISIVFLLLGS